MSQFPEENGLNQKIGTEEFIPPEIENNFNYCSLLSYDEKKRDIFALGKLLFNLVSGG